MKKNLNWAVLGCGVIANEMAQTIEKMGKNLYGVANRTYEKAVLFGERYKVQKVYSDFKEMIADDNVDIIYITTPHNTHITYIIDALNAGKHVLCEKSITLNSRELKEALKLANEKKLIFAEAMTIWHMPIYKKLWNYKEQLGRVQMIQINFGSFKEYDMSNRFFNMELAGGALLDIGVYAISLARSFMESKPDQIKTQVKYASTGADEQAGILLMNKEGQMATISLSLHSKQPKRAIISYENGYIEITDYPRAQKAVIVDAQTGDRHEIEEGSTEDALYYEMLDMEKAIHNNDCELMKISETSDVMNIMTDIRKEWNMKYPGEIW